jgi:hypothetical protein
MKIVGFLLVFFVSSIGFAQSDLIDQLKKQQWSVTQSEKIIDDPLAKKIIAEGEKNLFALAQLFTDTKETSIFSKCHNRNLRVRETAVILADHINRIPNFPIFQIQNCTMESCENNPNHIEYYLQYLPHRYLEIQNRYLTWLVDRDRWRYKKGKDRKRTKELVKEWKKQLENDGA